MATRPGPESFSAGVQTEGMRETLKAFRDLPKEASDELRKAALEMSRELATAIQAAGLSEGRQASELAGLVKAKFDRVPAVVVGGTKPIGRHGTPASQLLLGSEFGMNRGKGGKGSRDFRPHGFAPRSATAPGGRGNVGIWIFPTVEAHQADIARRWQEAADAIVEKFTENPGPRS